jgi:hypothetical protein
LKYHLYRNSFPVYALARFHNQSRYTKNLRIQIPSGRIPAAQRFLDRNEVLLRLSLTF